MAAGLMGHVFIHSIHWDGYIALAISLQKQKVDVTHLGLSELHNNVHTSRSVTFLDHYRSPVYCRQKVHNVSILAPS